MSATVSRRHFVGGLAAALGYFGSGAGVEIAARPGGPGRGGQARGPSVAPARRRMSLDEYDAAAKLAYNENPHGASDSVMKSMADAFKFGNRYNYPDGNLVDEIAAHHGLTRENVIVGAGSSEILEVAGRTFLQHGRKVIGVAPTFADVYEYASGVRAESIVLPLTADYRQDVDALARATRANHRDAGFVYLCNPNNPTGIVVTRQEVRRLLDAIPGDVPVLVDEAYHHYVEHPDYATSVPYILEGRPVIVARTFSKVYGLAGMRLGYGLAPKAIVDRMRPHCTGSVNALVKWAGVAALKDAEAERRVRESTLQLRRQTVAELETLGYEALPSDTNFFMVDLRRDIVPVIEAFRDRGVLVGRPFPPMLRHLRVSIGTAAEMDRFLTAFKQIVT